jgi:hypothetical protein
MSASFSLLPEAVFDLDSFRFDVLIRGLSAKHDAPPRKQAPNSIQSCLFHELIESGGTFSVNILCLPDKQSGLLPRMTMTKNVWLCVPVKSWLRFRSWRESDLC